MLQKLLIIIVTSFLSVCYADSATQPPSADKAFIVSGVVNSAKEIQLNWKMLPGYYLYKDKLTVTPDENSTAQIGSPVYPAGVPRHDVLHGNFAAYINQLGLPIPVLSTTGKLILKIGYQGCSSAGFCYTPVKKLLAVDTATMVPGQILLVKPYLKPTEEFDANGGYATQLLMGHHYIWMVLSFLFLGLLLAFTPCVLPMVPILSSIIIGTGHKLSPKKAFSLSLAYVLGMALAYAGAGIIVALAGKSIQIAMQKPWVIGLFSVLFVLLALSLFGLFDIQLPPKLQQRLASRTRNLTGGTYAGAFLMGIFSTLIVSPCVSAPLVGVLAYIAHSGDVILGAVALMSMGLGMGIPLLLLGASAGKLLPKAGTWMKTIKHIMGLMMLALAVWMLSRILPGNAILFLWSLFAITTALFIRQMHRSKLIWHKLHQGLGLLLLSYGFILMAGAIIGQTDPLYLLEKSPLKPTSAFAVVKNMDDLNHQLALAKSHNKQVILDFYADWCVSCVKMDRSVFTQPEIKSALAKFVLLRADITNDNAFDQELLQRYQVVAPPTMVFFNAEGEVIPKHQIVGEVDSKQFLVDIEDNLKSCEAPTSSC